MRHEFAKHIAQSVFRYTQFPYGTLTAAFCLLPSAWIDSASVLQIRAWGLNSYYYLIKQEG